MGTDSSIAAFHNTIEDAGFHADDNFDISSIPEKEWKEITADIPDELVDGLGSAVSMEHLRVLAARTRATVAAEQEMAEFGGWGVAGRFAFNMIGDPLAFAVAMSTGAAGALPKAARLAEAARVATAAGEFSEARRIADVLGTLSRQGKWAGAGRSALLAGAENAALEVVLDQGNLTRDGWDVAFAGLSGGLLGGMASRVFRGRELDNLRVAYAATNERLKIAELEHTLSVKQQQIETKLKWLDMDGNVDVTARELEHVRARHAKETAEFDQRLAAAAEPRRQEFETVLERARNSEDFRQQLDRQRGKAHEEVERLRERIESGDTSSQTRNQMARASRRWQERERLYENHVKRTAGHQKAAEDAQKALSGSPLDRLDADTRAQFLVEHKSLQSRLAEERQAAEAAHAHAVASVATRREQLTRALKGIDELRAAGVRAIDQETAALFGPDTASSARFMGFNEGTHPHLDEDSGLPSSNPVAQMGAQGTRGKIVDLLKFRKGIFATFGMVLRGSKSEVVRNQYGRMVGNTVGTVDGSVNTVGASEIAHILRQRYEARFNQLIQPAYKDWAERNGIGIMQRQTRLVREDFMSDVGRAIRGDESITDPAVLKVKSGWAKIFADYLQDGKDAGVKGFENVEPNAGYLPKVFDFHSFHEIEDTIGSDAVRLLFQRAIQAVHDDMPDAVAARISAAYVDTMKDLRVGANIGLMQGFKWDDVGFLRRFLTEAGIGSDEVEDVVGQMAALNARRQRQTEGSFRNAKHRVQMDDNFAMTFRNQKAYKEGRIEDVEVRVADMLENNVEALFGRYNRTVSGHIALAKVGIKSKADFEHATRLIERDLAGDLDELKRVKDYGEAAYSLLTGTPLSKATELTRIGRAVRDWNYTTTMGQAGWAQLPDFAGLLQKGYLSHTLKYFPEVFGTIKRKDGKIDLEFYRELEEWTGLGTDLFNNKVFSSYDWGEEGEGLSGALGKFEHGVRVAGRGVSRASGLAFMTEMAQRMAGRVIVQRLVKDVLDGGALSKDRAMQLGLDDAMKARIASQLKKHTTFKDGDFGGEVRTINYANWDDVDARDALLYAVSREARRLVQEEDLSDTALWMHTNWGKVLIQFRRFAMVSYTKQLLHGIAHADAEEATRVMISSVLAATAYWARHHTAMALKEAGGATPEELEQYREKYLGMDRLAAAALANSSYSSILPGLWDTGQYYTTGTRMFDTRSSGLGSDIITGNPSYRAVTGLGRAVGGSAQAILRGDRQFDERDARAWRYMLPFQNVLGMDVPFQALTSGLPEDDDDPDPDHFDWL